tara:strand:+ start:2721 stop:3332 length:612 start_codon:yes stop_codon:yes gene_type:complete
VIAIIDYGCGNVNAFINVFKRLNIKAIVTSRVSEIKDAKKIILPGVGSFDFVMKNLNESGLKKIIEKKVNHDKVDVLGVCAGMQIFADSSEEGTQKGLGWIRGKVKMFDVGKIDFKSKIPHMGWNNVNVKKNILFDGIQNNSRFYFVHSYYFDNSEPEESIGISEYGGEFTCAINKNNIYGVQFHPEKSHKCGEKLLYNFTKI